MVNEDVQDGEPIVSPFFRRVQEGRAYLVVLVDAMCLRSLQVRNMTIEGKTFKCVDMLNGEEHNELYNLPSPEAKDTGRAVLPEQYCWSDLISEGMRGEKVSHGSIV